MLNPTRRNKNIGTARQGHGSNNKLKIPDSWHDWHIYYKRMNKYSVVKRIINNKEFIFLVEKTRQDSFHACTVDDIVRILSYVNLDELEGLNLIVLRQTKRKEETLKPVWGRFNYLYDVDDKFEGPVIIIESQSNSKIIKWSKSLDTDDRKEFERLKSDGHIIKEFKNKFEFYKTIESCRNTQLYHTLLHEIGHYVHYLNNVKRPPHNEDEEDKLEETFDKINKNEKEVFAISYAENLKKELTQKGLIPFDRIINLESIKNDNLRIEDFVNKI